MGRKKSNTATVMCSSGLFLDAFAKRWKDAVSGAPATCSSHLASWIPVSGHSEGKRLSEARISPPSLYPNPTNG